MRLVPALLVSILAIAQPTVAADAPSLVKNLDAGKKQHIVCYGTSLTAGGAWVKQLEAALNKRYPGLVAITNSGGSGMASDWGVANLDAKVIKFKPDAVFIEFGVNDSATLKKISVETGRKNLEQMIDRIQKSNPACQVILMTMDPATGVPLTRRHDLEAYYQNYRDVAKDRGLLLIDLYVPWKALLDKDPKTFADYVPDGVHPTPKGAETIITPGILAALFPKKD